MKEDRSIGILRADKGNAIVIMDKIDYMNEVKELLNDQGKFCSVKEDELASDENIINRRLAKLKNDKKIFINEYNHLVTSKSSIPVLYYTVKVHKKNFSLRSIVSMCNAPNCYGRSNIFYHKRMLLLLHTITSMMILFSLVIFLSSCMCVFCFRYWLYKQILEGNEYRPNTNYKLAGYCNNTSKAKCIQMTKKNISIANGYNNNNIVLNCVCLL